MSLTAGLSFPVIAGIIGILLGIRAIDTKKKLARGFYITALLVAGFAAGFIITPYTEPFITWLQSAVMAGVAHAGAASILYQTGKLTLPSEDQFRFFHEDIDS